jgi:N-acetylmuramoyl-L-alanine amidase
MGYIKRDAEAGGTRGRPGLPGIQDTLKEGSNVMRGWVLGCCLALVLWGGAPGSEAGAKDFRVAIDVGHSPTSPGAISARGVPEYNFNRRVAHLLLAKLSQDPRFKGSFIVNEEGERVSLSSRPAMAESRSAGVFLSIHHDSVYPEQLSKWVYQGKLMDVCDEYGGYSVFFSEKNGSPAESHRLANLIGTEMRRSGFVPNLNHAGRGNRVLVDRSRGIYAFNNLVVLKWADIPAALVECGVIKNSLEEVKLCDPRQQQRIVEALYKAITTYASAR